MVKSAPVKEHPLKSIGLTDTTGRLFFFIVKIPKSVHDSVEDNVQSAAE